MNLIAYEPIPDDIREIKMVNEKILAIKEDSSSVQLHLSMIQNIVLRMASNSSTCKSLCVTLVSAILVIVADKGKPDYAWIALLPVLIFSFLDAYYLALEKSFRKAYDDFVQKLHGNKLQLTDLYSITPSKEMLTHQVAAMKSLSVWGFYIPLALLIAITKSITIG